MALQRESTSSVYAVVIPVRLLFATSSFVQSTGIRSDTVFGNSTPLRRAYGASCIRLIFSLFFRWDSFYWCFRVCLYYVFPSYHMLNQCLKLDLYLLRSRVTSCLIPIGIPILPCICVFFRFLLPESCRSLVWWVFPYWELVCMSRTSISASNLHVFPAWYAWYFSCSRVYIVPVYLIVLCSMFLNHDPVSFFVRQFRMPCIANLSPWYLYP